MKLPSQVCTLEQAKKLKALGIVQDAYFIWGEQGVITESWGVEGNEDVFYSAFTVAELGTMLPATIDGLKLPQWPIGFKEAAPTYGMQYRWDAHDAHHRVYPLHVVFGDSEAQARADLLICLIADGKVSAEEVNQRLKNA